MEVHAKAERKTRPLACDKIVKGHAGQNLITPTDLVKIEFISRSAWIFSVKLKN